MADRWLTIDPGEDTGLSLWEDEALIDAYTLKMRDVADLLWSWLTGEVTNASVEHSEFFAQLQGHKLIRVVCEDWVIYPWKAKSLAWDECRTARLIGAITWVVNKFDVPVHFQGAKIKEEAVAAGAENYFLSPRHENRHANDAIMHGVWYNLHNADQVRPGNVRS